MFLSSSGFGFDKETSFFSFLNFTAINLLNLHALPIFGGGKRRARAAQRRKNEGTFCALFSKPPKTSLADRGNSKLCKELSTLRAFKLLRGRLRRTKSRQFVDERWWCFYSTITSKRAIIMWKWKIWFPLRLTRKLLSKGTIQTWFTIFSSACHKTSFCPIGC